MYEMIYYLFLTHIISYWATVLFYTYVFNQWSEESWYVIKNVLFNQFVITPIYLPFFLYYPEPYPYDNVIWQLPVIVVLTDIIFYSCHRVFHWNKALYVYVHEKHHEYDPPIASAALYSHPLEHLCINLSSTVVPMFLVHASFPVAMLWTLIASVNVVVAHSEIHGGQHTLHHKYKACNYGVGLMVMDRLLGTYR